MSACRRSIVAGCLGLGLGLGLAASAHADTRMPITSPALEEKLKTFDPTAVAAAKHYYLQPSVRAGMIAMSENMNKAMLGIVMKQNPRLSPEKAQNLGRIVNQVTRERLNLLLEMSMVVALETFSTGELVALDKFYASPEGASILAKMPRLSAQLPAMMQAIMPDYMAELKDKLQQNGAELKL